MIKEALQYIVGLNKPDIMDIQGKDGVVTTYSDKQLLEVRPSIPRADFLWMHTLTSLVDYLKEEVDTMGEHMLIHVESPEEVHLISALDERRKREELCRVGASIPSFNFGQYYDSESFVIALQSMFIPTPDLDLILKFAGTSEAGTIASYGDDGVTQKATIKQGIVNKEDAIIPNPVSLRPYRTFVEVEQPESKFIFRMKQDRDLGIRCAIFEADGGAWKNEACKNVKRFLEEELEGFDSTKITVIS